MLLFSTAVFTVAQWIFLCQWAHDRDLDSQYTAAIRTLSTQPLSTVNYHRGTQVSPNLIYSVSFFIAFSYMNRPSPPSNLQLSHYAILRPLVPRIYLNSDRLLHLRFYQTTY